LYVAQRAADNGQIDLARKIWWESFEQFKQSGDIWYMAMVYSFFGARERRLGNYDESERNFHQAIAYYTEIGDQWGRTIMFMHLGMIALYRDDPVTARDWFQKRLRIGREIGFKFSEPYSTFPDRPHLLEIWRYRGNGSVLPSSHPSPSTDRDLRNTGRLS
jgi:hypothetical protein